MVNLSSTDTNKPITLQCGWTSHLIHTTVSTDPRLSQEPVCNVYLYSDCPQDCIDDFNVPTT